MQRERRSDPHPWSWELPVGICAVLALVVLVGLQLGRSLANLIAGAGWTWPAPDQGATAPSPIGAAFWASLPGILTGDAGAGLPAADPTALAGPVLLWLCMGACELALMTTAALTLGYGWRRYGPNRVRGVASRTEAESLLGVSRLRRVAPLVRPDLHGKRARPADRPEPPPRHEAGVVVAAHDGAAATSPWLARRPGRGEARDR